MKINSFNFEWETTFFQVQEQKYSLYMHIVPQMIFKPSSLSQFFITTARPH